jgi:hypothetical protein
MRGTTNNKADNNEYRGMMYDVPLSLQTRHSPYKHETVGAFFFFLFLLGIFFFFLSMPSPL